MVAEFDRLYILAAPREEQDAAEASAAPESDDDANVLAVEQDAKLKRVLSAENEWVKVRAAAMRVRGRHGGFSWAKQQG